MHMYQNLLLEHYHHRILEIKWVVQWATLQKKQSDKLTISDTNWLGIFLHDSVISRQEIHPENISVHIFGRTKHQKRGPKACPEICVQHKSLSLTWLSERFTFQTVNYFTRSGETTEISMFTKLTVYLGILKSP